MKECSIQLDEHNGLSFLMLDGSLDAYSFPKLESVLGQLWESGKHRVVLDCSGLEYVSSAALGALIGFARRAREKGGDLKLAHLPPKIFNIVELLGFNKILDVCETVKDAEARFLAAN